MALDLRGCGIGNIVFEAAAHAHNCAVRGIPAAIVHDDPTELGILDLTRFDVTSDASRADPTLNPMYCCLRAFFSPEVRESMRSVVRPRDVPIDMTGVEAGFCFRISNPALDGDAEFMSDAAIDRMIAEMKKYSRVFACSNSEELLRRVVASHPNVATLGSDDFSARNADDHALQWHALAACPLVYHGIRGRAGGTTSTFAPAAAAYGQRRRFLGPIIPVGIDNAGELYAGPVGSNRYGW